MAQSIYQPKAETRTFALAELLGLLSHALDITEGQPPGHCVRCAWIGTKVGMAAGLSGEALSDLYFTLLLKDLGCSSNAARICGLYLTDDLHFKRDFKRIDDSLSSVLRFVFAKTGLQAGLAERFRALINILQNGGEIARDLIEARCHRGADIAALMGFGPGVQDGIRNLDEHWDGGGKPQGRARADIPLQSQIALIAQVADVFRAHHSTDEVLAELHRRAGRWFDPALVRTFETAARAPDFWTVLEGPDLHARVFALPPARDSAPADEDRLDDIARAFAMVIDAKSPFTADHSARVALYTDMIAEELGLTVGHRRWLHRAALLHDLGKLAVSNSVLDKPGRPDPAEWDMIRQHPLLSERLLEQMAAFADIAPIAGAHHERLDGKGYPYGLHGGQICLEVRILTVADVFDALSADRPYRAALPLDQVFALLEADCGSAFDPICVAALRRGIDRLQAAA